MKPVTVQGLVPEHGVLNSPLPMVARLPLPSPPTDPLNLHERSISATDLGPRSATVANHEGGMTSESRQSLSSRTVVCQEIRSRSVMFGWPMLR